MNTISRWKPGLRSLILTAVMMGASAVAGAATIQATPVNLISYGTVEVSLNSGSQWELSYAGTIAMQRTGGDSLIELEPDVVNFVTFCIEPRESVSVGGNYTWEVEDLSNGTTSLNGMGSVKADQIRELIANEYATFGGSLTNIRAAALQIAIWEIVEEQSGSLNLTNGSIQFRNPSLAGTLQLAQGMLNNLDGAGPKAPFLYALTNAGKQDMLVMAGPEAVPNVEAPEPSTCAFLGIGLLALGAFRRKSGAGAR